MRVHLQAWKKEGLRPMEVVRGVDALRKTHPELAQEKPVITIGNFDGVHLGHQKIIGLARAKAKERGGICVAYTFRPHPQVALRPGADVQLLSTYEEKLELLSQAGVDLTVEEPFSREFSTISAEQFFNEIVLRTLGAKAVVVGYDFAFGKGRQGHLQSLEAFCKSAGVELTVVPAHRIHDDVVSSSRIRQYLLGGDVKSASQLLGRPFSYKGVVIKGEGRGKKIGFPTANLKLDNKLAIPYGVYATWAKEGEKIYPSVTNVGVRPTFQAKGEPELPALVETHLLDVTLDLYGLTLEVGFVDRLREERKFSGVEALKAQISKDATDARTLLKTPR